LRGKLGRNAYGTVYHGWDRKLKRPVAVMELHRKFRSDSARLDASWTQVMRLAGLTHDHLVPVFSGEKDLGWIVMELMQANLAEKLKEGPLDPELVRSVLRQALEALEFLHAHHSPHGDIRPATILVSAQGQIKLSFSVGVALCGEIPWELRSLKYVAPELLDPEFGPAGPAADLYCLGFSALELLVGPGFDARFQRAGEKPEAAWAYWHGSRSRQVPKAKELVAGIPADLARVIDRLLIKQVSGRYASAAEALGDLPPETMSVPEVAKRLTQSGLQTVELSRTASAPPPGPAAPLVRSPNWADRQERAQGSRAMRYIALALVLALLIAGGAIGWRHRPAIEEFLRGQFAASPEDADTVQGPSAEAAALYRSGVADNDQGDFGKAIADLTEAIRLAPRFAEAYQERGIAYMGEHDWENAVVDFSAAIGMNRKYAKAYNNRGIAYSKLDKLGEAIADYTEAIRLEPNQAMAYINRGIAYRSQGEREKAIADYTEAIRLDPGRADTYYLRARAQLEDGAADAAIADCTEAIRLDPKHAGAYGVRASAYEATGDLQSAEADRARQRELVPQR
jgi:tetratricopeptide (TPR) repeat protein